MSDKKIINPSPKNWINNNKELLRAYRGKWIVYNETGVLASSDSFVKLSRAAAKLKQTFKYYYVPSNMDVVRILPIRFYTLKTHDWKPLYQVRLSFEKKELELDMLVDSGADVSLIPFDLGVKLGLRLSKGETILKAEGVGGNIISYVSRDVNFTIDKHSFVAPLAWVQDSSCLDRILGREKIFDLFNIEFRQADEEIIFKWRGNKS